MSGSSNFDILYNPFVNTQNQNTFAYINLSESGIDELISLSFGDAFFMRNGKRAVYWKTDIVKTIPDKVTNEYIKDDPTAVRHIFITDTIEKLAIAVDGKGHYHGGQEKTCNLDITYPLSKCPLTDERSDADSTPSWYKHLSTYKSEPEKPQDNKDTRFIQAVNKKLDIIQDHLTDIIKLKDLVMENRLEEMIL